IYPVPRVLHDEGLDDYVARRLGIDVQPDLTDWRVLSDRIDSATEPVRIAIVGKYVNLRDAYLSVIEALRHGGFHHGAHVEISWVASHELAGVSAEEIREVPGGSLVHRRLGGRGRGGTAAPRTFPRD